LVVPPQLRRAFFLVFLLFGPQSSRRSPPLFVQEGFFFPPRSSFPSFWLSFSRIKNFFLSGPLFFPPSLSCAAEPFFFPSLFFVFGSAGSDFPFLAALASLFSLPGTFPFPGQFSSAGSLSPPPEPPHLRGKVFFLQLFPPDGDLFRFPGLFSTPAFPFQQTPYFSFACLSLQDCPPPPSRFQDRPLQVVLCPQNPLRFTGAPLLSVAMFPSSWSWEGSSPPQRQGFFFLF